MALFQKKPLVGTSVPLYTIGSNKSVLIVGLGNPEKKFEGTRHNIGFAALDYFAKKNEFPDWVNKKDLKCELTMATLRDIRVILCKPTTYMNNSGEAAQAVQHFYKVYNQQTLAVYDELAIQFGQLRTRIGGSDAGHNGVKSLVQHIGDDFSRLRIGVGNETSEKADASDFVLSKFTRQEQGYLPLILREANSLINDFAFGGNLPHETRNVL
jgi:PTH1 family peptidyl-tRNA hydrolase